VLSVCVGVAKLVRSCCCVVDDDLVGEKQDVPLYARYLEGRIMGEQEAGIRPAMQPLCFLREQHGIAE
jgi:hypothetical protein